MAQAAGNRIRICNDNRQLAEESDIIIIGVKPDAVEQVLKEISPAKEKSSYQWPQV